jgi:hypothetical protein
VHDGGRAGLIHEIDVKALARRERDARFSVRPDKGEYSCRFAVDVEISGAGSQAKLGDSGEALARVVDTKGSVPAMATPVARIWRRVTSVGLSLSLMATLPIWITFGNWPSVQFDASPALPRFAWLSIMPTASSLRCLFSRMFSIRDLAMPHSTKTMPP